MFFVLSLFYIQHLQHCCVCLFSVLNKINPKWKWKKKWFEVRVFKWACVFSFIRSYVFFMYDTHYSVGLFVAYGRNCGENICCCCCRCSHSSQHWFHFWTKIAAIADTDFVAGLCVYVCLHFNVNAISLLGMKKKTVEKPRINGKGENPWVHKEIEAPLVLIDCNQKSSLNQNEILNWEIADDTHTHTCPPIHSNIDNVVLILYADTFQCVSRYMWIACGLFMFSASASVSTVAIPNVIFYYLFSTIDEHTNTHKKKIPSNLLQRFSKSLL